jgi:hypothetical protein
VCTAMELAFTQELAFSSLHAVADSLRTIGAAYKAGVGQDRGASFLSCKCVRRDWTVTGGTICTVNQYFRILQMSKLRVVAHIHRLQKPMKPRDRLLHTS